jgi:hypothetical protein
MPKNTAETERKVRAHGYAVAPLPGLARQKFGYYLHTDNTIVRLPADVYAMEAYLSKGFLYGPIPQLEKIQAKRLEKLVGIMNGTVSPERTDDEEAGEVVLGNIDVDLDKDYVKPAEEPADTSLAEEAATWIDEKPAETEAEPSKPKGVKAKRKSKRKTKKGV